MENPTQTAAQNTGSEVKFSGPWSVTSKFTGPLHIEDVGGNVIAHVGHEDFRTCCAIAELIASAPELLTALIELRADIASLRWGQSYPGRNHALMDRVDAAIARATA